MAASDIGLVFSTVQGITLRARQMARKGFENNGPIMGVS